MTPLLPSSEHYLQNLYAMQSQDAKRLWRKAIKEKNNYECIYCGHKHPEQHLTIDHVHPRSLGGNNFSSNCVPACIECNQSKGSSYWLSWFRSTFPPNPLTEQRIVQWIQ
jgi:hypothetical protein